MYQQCGCRMPMCRMPSPWWEEPKEATGSSCTESVPQCGAGATSGVGQGRAVGSRARKGIC